MILIRVIFINPLTTKFLISHIRDVSVEHTFRYLTVTTTYYWTNYLLLSSFLRQI